MTPLLDALVDDAGLFPPSSLPMEEALARHRASSHAMLTGRFLCPADRVVELGAALHAPLDVHLIGDDVFDLPTDANVVVRGVELRSAVMTQVPCYVEGVDPSVLAGKGVFGKVRCGGARVPPVDELAAYVRECARLSLPFKATAGLHSAVRGWESTDDEAHHGYLNLLLAVARALNGADVEAVLASTDAESLVAEAKLMDLELAATTRALFHSYGSCDTDRPVRDAITLGLA